MKKPEKIRLFAFALSFLDFERTHTARSLFFSPAPFAFSRESGLYTEEHMNLTPDLEIVYLDPHDLTPYEGNARKHGDVDVQGIKDSIETDGFNDPIGIWGDRNLIVEGHGRQIAAIELGMKKVPCIRLDHLTDTQRRDYAIRHNRTAELSEWDEAKRKLEMAALEMEGVDFSGLQFDEYFDTGEYSDTFSLDSGDKSPFCQMTFNLANEQAELIKTALQTVSGECVDTYGNTNSNGNALYEVVRQWTELRE